jgi:hypothetical protein
MDAQICAVLLTDRERFVLLGFVLSPSVVILANRIERAKMEEVFEALGLVELEAELAELGGKAPATDFDHEAPRPWTVRPALAGWLAAKLERPMPVALARVLDPVIERLEVAARPGPPLAVVPAAAGAGSS